MANLLKKITLLFLSVFIISAVLPGCSSVKSTSYEKSNNDYTFTDDLGRSVAVTKNNNNFKIAACLGSLADIWHLAGGRIAGTTEDGFNNDRGYDADYGINLGSNKSPNVELIISLKPDLVLMSANLEGHKKIMDTLENAGIRTAYFSVESFDDYLNVLHIFTDITGSIENYKKYGTDVKERIENIITAAGDKEKHDVLLLRASGRDIRAKNSKNMVGIMLKDLGCNNIADSDNTVLENLSVEAVLADNPDFIFIIPMGDDEDAKSAVDREILESAAWQRLDAVKNGRVIMLQKEYFHYKPNEKWCDSYEILAGYLYGE